MSTAKELLGKIKALFDNMMPPAPPAPAPAAPPAGKLYTLQDGTTQISIVQAGDTPAAGDVVTINGVPAPANTYTLQDGSTLTTDATGTITAYVAAAPVTVDPAEAAKQAPPAAPAAPACPKFSLTPENIKAAFDKMTPDGMAAMFEAFATGSSDDRIANLELVSKALMEYCFGWQIREAQQKITTDQAIEVYKQDLITAQAALTKHEQTVAAQDARIKKQEEVLKLTFELVEQLAAIPTADPVTPTGNKKDRFSKAEKAEEKFKRIADSMKSVRETV